MHRGGIVNIWQYREQVFDFSGGRAVFQGTNGSGKSRTLELLLPLCLDGDLRHLGSKGAGTVSIRRLMLDDYDGGPNRIGYAWIELERDGESGPQGPEKQYLTCGLGVKASATSQQISDSWRFVTPQRIGFDVQVVGSDRVPLGPAALRDVLGADRVLDEAAFRAKVAETVYGVPAPRYGDLLHLQRTLRNPDIGLKVLEGQLEQILSDALPPLDAGMIEQLAASFEDLESIRENITSLASADTALQAFLDGYRGYALGALRSSGTAARAAQSTVDKALAEVRRLSNRLDQHKAQHDEAREQVTAMETREVELEEGVAALKELPAYLGLRDLQDRERLVGQAREGAVRALENAASMRANADRAVETVLTALRRLSEDTDSAIEHAGTTAAKLAAAGLDRNLAPKVPAAPMAEPRTKADKVRAKPDPEAEPLEIQRRVPPTLAPDELTEALTAAAAQAAEAISAATQRVALTSSLYERAAGADKRDQDVDRLRDTARQAQIEATEAAGRRNEARQRLTDAAHVWCEQAEQWTLAGPFAGDHAPRPPRPGTVDDVLADPGATRAAHETARQWAAPHLRSLRQRVAGAEQLVSGVDKQIAETEARLIELRKGRDTTPARHPYVAASRDTEAGAPFYRLVDFAPGVSPESRAGIEAALQSSGLLTAWVGPAEDDDIWLDGAEPVSGPSLADVLVPAVETGSPVSAQVVAALLQSIALDADGALSVSPSGQWRAGVLHGALSKADAEYVGAGARDAARTRAVAELSATLEELAAQRDTAVEELNTAQRDVTAWESHLEAFPDDRALITAHATAAAADTLAVEGASRAERLRAELDAEQGRFAAVRTELAQDAAAAGLPAETEALRRANAAATEARTSAQQLREALTRRCVSTVRDLADALHDHAAADDDRDTAEQAAEAQCTAFAREARALEDLRSSIGGEAEEISRRLAAMESQRREVRAGLPAAREAATEASNQVAKTETLLETRRAEIDGKREAADRAVAAFREALAAPGVWPAAVPGNETVPGSETAPEDPDEAMTALEAVSTKTVAEEKVITKLQALQTALAGSHNVLTERHAGLLTVVVAAEDGPRPVAVAATRVAERLNERRGYLTESYQGIFALHLVRELADRLSAQIEIAEDLCRRMNDVLDTARSSQGVHVQLEWRPASWLDDATTEALTLLRTPFAKRTPDQDERLRRAFTERIEAERDAANDSYSEILARALDYRAWFAFTVRVRDTGPDGKPRLRRLRQLSSGETRLISYVTLFAAAAAFYSAIAAGAAGMEPLRLVLLDEAFERLDDPTIARMLGLLVDLDMDWVITWPSGWGVSPKIPRMHIYDVLRPKSGHGVACTHTTWDGAALDRDDP
ncbi:TIGR02680 family protein [Labedaea rhizosphaerae]|uniref:TIGR02680 family protein n=1 Tax=Labedaea rhizosphaerae TaxID=598644 RepID=UPI001FB62186|nr:TIGR02680 family protein [Labedaea rhizosphaerae]